MLWCNVLDTAPCYTLIFASTGATVVVLSIEACLEPKISLPRQPSLWLNQVINGRLHDDGPRVLLPWTAQICLVFMPQGVVCRIRGKSAVYDDDSSWLAPLFPALSSDNARLIGHWLAHHESAVLENCGSITKNKVNGTGDGAVTVELALDMCVKCVLVASKCAPVENSLIGTDPNCHSLMFIRTS